jgi:copper chaperone NosL
MKISTPFALLVLLLLALGGLAGCGRAPSSEAQPPEILFGQDLCEACGMLIDQPQFAAATVTLDGSAYKFDGISDMVAYHAEHPLAQVRAWFVHDYNSEDWLRAEVAFFVHSDLIVGPMGHGIAAFASEAEAQRLAADLQASVTSFDVLRAELAATSHTAH